MAAPSVPSFSIVVPCYNKEGAIAETIDHLRRTIPTGREYEVIVVNDGSTDGTARILEEIVAADETIRVATHVRNRGYGAALKTGIRLARAELIVITDADGTYPNDRIPELVDLCADNDMVVGARTGADVQYSRLRAFPKIFLKAWVSWVAGQRVPDINSGMRVFRKGVAESFFGILPDTFSFTITITLAMLTNYRPVQYVPIAYHPRIGKSKISPIRDTLRFMTLIVLRRYSPDSGLH